jgi:hypothetical protein
MGPHRAHITRKAARTETDGHWAVGEVWQDPGFDNPPHTHDEAEAFYVLEGSYTFYTDADPVEEVGPGTLQCPVQAGWLLSHCAARCRDALESHASWTISCSSAKDSSPRRLARTSTDGCPSKWAVEKNGVDSSWIKACFSASSATQNTMTSL